MKKDADILNVLLIVISLFLAFRLPFELFLFSYAVLGPLHYLTEINWLRQKDFFVKQTKWIGLFVALVAIITVPFVLQLAVFSGLQSLPVVEQLTLLVRKSFSSIILASFLFAIGLVTFSKRLHLVLFLAGSFAAAYLMLRYVPNAVIFTNVFLPTLIHVYVFTLLFMVYGTMQAKSTPGIVAIVLLLLAPVIIALSRIDASQYSVAKYTQDSFDAMGFGVIHYNLARFFSPGTSENALFVSPIGIKIQVFVAFAYTYHYLNWFSKTTVIGWHKNLSRPKVIGVLVLWMACIGIYAYDYKTGIIALTFLSFSHIFLEFPLNVASIKGIWRKATARTA